MNFERHPPDPKFIVRAMFAAGTVLFAFIGFSIDDGTKFFTASAAFGALWWGWDLLVDHVITPFEYWLEDMASGGALRYEGSAKYRSSKWTVDDRIVMLSERMKAGKTKRLQIHAAIRLAELYDLQKKDTERASAVISAIRERYPDAPELKRVPW